MFVHQHIYIQKSILLDFWGKIMSKVSKSGGGTDTELGGTALSRVE